MGADPAFIAHVERIRGAVSKSILEARDERQAKGAADSPGAITASAITPLIAELARIAARLDAIEGPR